VDDKGSVPVPDPVHQYLDDEENSEERLELRPHKWAADKWITRPKNYAVFT
jgi:hypothetical protein